MVQALKNGITRIGFGKIYNNKKSVRYLVFRKNAESVSSSYEVYEYE